MIKSVIRTNERNDIIQSLTSGVTPRSGIKHIQVGRVNEMNSLYSDIRKIADGGSAFRLVVGDYGAGKTFFLSVVRSIALENSLVTVNADLSPDRRIHSTSGHARSLYSELMRNIATKSMPKGNALKSIVESFINKAKDDAQSSNKPVDEIIQDRLSELTDYVGGHQFASVIGSYYKGHAEKKTELKESAIRWLKAEYETKTDVYRDLGVRGFIDDSSFYDYLKLMSLFVRQAGYAGLLVNLDEMVNLFKLSHPQSRNANYEQILRILNDCLQGGSSKHIGFILGGTPEFLFNNYKGLYSYEALQSRLAPNSSAQKAGVIDYNSTVLQLANLTPEELFILLKNIRNVYACGNEDAYLVPDDALVEFLKHCSTTIGDAYFRTPRNTIKAFIDMLSVLDQHRDVKWETLIGSVSVAKDEAGKMEGLGEIEDDEMTNFTL